MAHWNLTMTWMSRIESKAKSNRKRNRIRVKDNNPIAYKYFDQLD